MAEYRVIIPTPTYRIVSFEQDDLPGIAVINEQLAGFEPKIVFAWHLSLKLQMEDLIGNGMPSRPECKLLDEFGELLESIFVGDEPEKPNALFLSRITWNGTRELVYRVYKREPIHEYLGNLIDQKFHPRPFEYRIDADPEWALAHWHLNAGLSDRGARSSGEENP